MSVNLKCINNYKHILLNKLNIEEPKPFNIILEICTNKTYHKKYASHVSDLSRGERNGKDVGMR
tara:strand:+ start:9078 stop:9269 length:192 start_codon:yes stop_codon:yes gene_type:complete